MARAWSHCPGKFRMNSLERLSASMRATCWDKFLRNLFWAASRNSSSSGIDDQRKYDKREAREYSSRRG